MYNVPAECWFYSITQKDTKMMYVQDSNCSMENSDFCDLSGDDIVKEFENTASPRRLSQALHLHDNSASSMLPYWRIRAMSRK